jgi:hypothetical protein
MGMKRDEWLSVYEYCTTGEYNFLYYNMMKPKPLRIMKNFDELISIDRE